MQFTAHYEELVPSRGHRLEYWRTIYADDQREADDTARRWRRKGWQLLSVIQIL